MSRIFLLGLLVPVLCCAGEPPTDELEAVVVTASPIGDPDSLATIAGSVNRDSLLRSGGANLADALDWVPGVTGSGVAAGASRPVIRGFDANRVRTLEDGVGSFDVSDVGADHGVPLDPLTAQRVEIVRGAATLRYGSQAIGGVVNAITNRVPYERGPETLQGETTASYSSVSDGWNASGQLNLDVGAFGLHGDAFVRRVGDYDTPLGRLDNSWVDNEGGALGGTWFIKEGSEDDRLGLGAVHYASRYGLPGETTHIDMEQSKLLLRSAFELGAADRQLTVDGGWADYAHSEIDTDGEVGSTFRDRSWELRGEMLFDAWRALTESALGAQLQDRDFSALGEGADYLAPTRTRSQALFGFTEAKLASRLRLQVGARVESVSITGTPLSDELTRRDFTPLSGSIGLVLDGQGPWRAGLSLSSAARAPAQTELYARGPHDGSSTFEIGDPSLDVERANSLELSLRWRQGRVHADGALWVANFDGFIYGNLTGRTCDESGDCVEGDALDFRELRYEQRTARFTGAEGHADIELARWGGGVLALNLIGDIVRAQFTSDDTSVPRIPPWRLGAGFSWEAEHFDASLRYRYAGRQDDYGEGDTPTAGFANIDAQFGWRPFGADAGLEVVLMGSNLTNSLQRNAVALNKDEVPMAGRDIRLLVRGTF